MKLGLQVWTIEQDLIKDMDGALKAVKEMGYDYVEFGNFYGRTADELASLLEKHGLTCISVHQPYTAVLEKPEETIAYYKRLGIKYCAIPWMGVESHKGSDGYEQAVKDITKVGQLLKKAGIQLLYHNHDFEFQKYEDKFLLDWLLEAVPAEYLQPQLDTCWIHYAGYNPAEYIKAQTGRITVIHLKDFVCKRLKGEPVYELQGVEAGEEIDSARDDNGFDFRPCGQGRQNFPEILEAAKQAGVEYAIVEQDGCNTAPPLESVRQSIEYLKPLFV